MIDKKVIEEIVVNILKKEGITSKGAKPTLLVICSEDPEENTLEILRQHWRITILDPANDEVPFGTNQAVFLDVNQDLLVKGALGIADTKESLFFSKLVMQESKIQFVPSAALNWLLHSSDGYPSNSSYKDLLSNYCEILRGFGVSFLSIEEIVPEEVPTTFYAQKNIPNYEGKLLTQDVVKTWQKKEIYITKKTIVTPLARDVARELKIEIHKSES
ncbi:hypothetical protein [Virgibacillus necropolis]|uniref:Uncharacterized protein n=1 Tax=Virgibacillus necropolis TaxID=163877 RepID=A0A221M9L9_9BACI|nr:hypothetical protein [Virgibacillus necropolis]ASN04346.1 hypothetical protein CFK40_04645 [Virgibacillus necropolis]